MSGASRRPLPFRLLQRSHPPVGLVRHFGGAILTRSPGSGPGQSNFSNITRFRSLHNVPLESPDDLAYKLNFSRSRCSPGFRTLANFAPMSVKFRVYIVRHGETDWNRTRKLQGQSDVALNETGLKQSILVGEALKDVPFVKAFSSDLQRAVKTAECILRHHPNVVPEGEASIRERYYLVESTGKTPRSDKMVPAAETMSAFAARCLAWYRSKVENYMISMAKGVPREQPHNILVVSHGGWILTLLTALRASGAVTCLQGVEIGYCLNTGVSIIEYTDIPGEGESPLAGRLTLYSGVDHLVRSNMTPLEVNADVLGDEWWQP